MDHWQTGLYDYRVLTRPLSSSVEQAQDLNSSFYLDWCQCKGPQTCLSFSRCDYCMLCEMEMRRVVEPPHVWWVKTAALRPLELQLHHFVSKQRGDGSLNWSQSNITQRNLQDEIAGLLSVSV